MLYLSTNIDVLKKSSCIDIGYDDDDDDNQTPHIRIIFGSFLTNADNNEFTIICHTYLIREFRSKQ